jgi:hypothetical protein
MGIRSLQLRNVVEAKYERILVPIADVLVAADQRRHVTFDAFFRHIIFQAMAHRLGVPGPEDGNVNGHWPLEEEAQAVEMAKADILALYMAEEMRKKGEITEEELIDHYVCALANTFRSVRYGAGSAHGRAHLLLFNFLMQAGAFVREQDTGTYRVVPGRMHQAITELAQKILHIQGDCNLAQARDLMGGLATKGARLQQDLGRIREAHIPIELVFEQGLEDRAGKDVAR